MYTQALSHLRGCDPRMAAIIDRVGACRFAPVTEGTHYEALLRSIIYQQLSGKAASTIHGRFLALYPRRSPTAERVLATSDDALRSVGLSRQKIGYMRDLSAKVATRDLPVRTLHTLDDEALIESLVRVKGIGRWTAQMFLMFRLGRPDVLPELDLGIQKAIRINWRKRSLPPPKAVLRIGEPWKPYRSIASWYLWRSLDLPAT